MKRERGIPPRYIRPERYASFTIRNISHDLARRRWQRTHTTRTWRERYIINLATSILFTHGMHILTENDDKVIFVNASSFLVNMFG